MRATFFRSLLAAAAAMWCHVAAAQERFALVIGNDNYRDVTRLDRARGDAQAVASRLTTLGFKVDLVHDTDRRTFNAALAGFKAKLSPGAIVYFHFSGHGIELDGESFLLPVDVPAPKDLNKDLVKAESIRLHEIIAGLKESGAATRVLVIDACRDNPFATKFGRSVGSTRGLGTPAGAPAGTFLMFSAGAGQAALDRLGEQDREPTSVYTRVLLKHLGAPDKDLARIAQDIKAEVRQLAASVGHEQNPSYYDELTDRLTLAGRTPVAVAPSPAVPAPGPALVPVQPRAPSRLALLPQASPGPAMIFPDSNARFLTQQEVAALARRSPQAIQTARNEIFARHGRRFTVASVDAHFRQYPWYRPLTADDASILSRLNLFERANLDLLRLFER